MTFGVAQDGSDSINFNKTVTNNHTHTFSNEEQNFIFPTKIFFPDLARVRDGPFFRTVF